jgi:hypothetical protein
MASLTVDSTQILVVHPVMMSDPQLGEDRIQVGLIEATETMLVDDDIVGLRCQFRDNIRMPRVSNQDATVGPIRGPHGLSEARQLFMNEVGQLDPGRLIQRGAITISEVPEGVNRVVDHRWHRAHD